MIDDLPFGDEPSGPPAALLTCRPDGTVGFSELKKLALSGRQYLHACNHRSPPTPPMLLGTAVHHLVLGGSSGRPPLLVYPGAARRGKAWDAFLAAHPGAEIVTAKEQRLAEQIADAVMRDPCAAERLAGARYEVPLVWEEDGIPCSTTGVDIVKNGTLGDLKTATTTNPEDLQRQAFKMFYHCQLAFYARGARANGIDTSKGLFLLCVETKGPHEVVDLELSEGLIDLADRTVSLWIEKLRIYRDANQWPGYAQSPIPWDVPGWMRDDDDEEGDL